MKLSRFSLFGVLLCCGSWTVDVSALEEVPHPVTAELIAEHASIQPGGTTCIGVHFELEDGWHIYADPPGDAGLPTTIAWSGGCATFDITQWPQARSFEEPGNIRTFGYEDSVVAYATLHGICQYYVVDETTKILVQAKVRWLACREICIPDSANLELTLPVSLHAPAFSTHAQLFEQTE